MNSGFRDIRLRQNAPDLSESVRTEDLTRRMAEATAPNAEGELWRAPDSAAGSCRPLGDKFQRRTTINTLWEHYSQEELPLKALSTQDAYIIYAKNWIVPRWGNLPLEQVKTVEVERWLRATGVADGTKAKIKCVMSALFSHAVRWEFCGHNPISSGIPVGTGGKRGPSTGVRISAKRQRSPLVLSPEQVKLGLAELEFRDQLLVFLEGPWVYVKANSGRYAGCRAISTT
jgi:hypothetical protein